MPRDDSPVSNSNQGQQSDEENQLDQGYEASISSSNSQGSFDLTLTHKFGL